MKNYETLSHTKLDCKYHVALIVVAGIFVRVGRTTFRHSCEGTNPVPLFAGTTYEQWEHGGGAVWDESDKKLGNGCMFQRLREAIIPVLPRHPDC